MIVGHTIDEEGYWTGDVIAGSGIVPDVTVRCPDGLYRARWDAEAEAWTEGMPDEERRAIRSAMKPVPPEMCKPWFDLDADEWIETATPEELAEWVPPAPPPTVPEKISALEFQNATLLMDAANKDVQISQQNAMIADLMMQVAMLQTGGA